MNNYTLGIDIGGISIKYGVLDNENIKEFSSFRNVYKRRQESLVVNLVKAIDVLIKKYQINKIGIASPGIIHNGVVVFANNLSWRNFKIVEELHKYYPSHEIYLRNDGYASFKCEREFGYLKDCKNGLFITIGKGIGGAIVQNGMIINGISNEGVKIGHMVIDKNGRRCSCGRRGCYERYASTSGLIETFVEYNNKSTNKIDLPPCGKLISELYEKNNQIAIDTVNTWLNDMGEGILNLCELFDPEMVVIAGGITEGNLINLDVIKNKLSSKGYNCEVKVAKYKGKTGLIGAGIC